MTNEELVSGYRALADWYEAHPDAPMPYEPGATVLSFDREDADEARRIAKMLGTFEKDGDDKFFRLSKAFGGVKLEFVFYRDRVCQPRVVGTKTVMVPAAAPPIVPPDTPMVEKQIDIVEWDCPPLLGDAARENPEEFKQTARAA